MNKQVRNFNAGPTALPKSVLEQAQRELLNFKNTGMSVMELSHRSPEYKELHQHTQQLLRKLMNIPNDYSILFLQGGASLQFSMIPTAFLDEEGVGSYIVSGSFAEKAFKEAEKIGKVEVIASSKNTNYDKIPDNFQEPATNSRYLHITSNNTIYGTQWQEFNQLQHQTIFADMSSDILSRKIPVDKFSLIYAGAQKNLGPSGVTVVIVKNSVLDSISDTCPSMLNYKTQVKNDSLYNTPPTFAVYMLSLVLQWVENQGGVSEIEKMNNKKADLLYKFIDENSDFYTGIAQVNSRSKMNVTSKLNNEDLNAQFLQEAKDLGFVGINGHRSVGGCRISLYNAISYEICEDLVQYMESFRKKHL